MLIWTNSNDAQPIANCNNGIVKIRLANATQTCLAQLDWSLAVHISAPDGNGSVFVDTEAPANPEPNGGGWVAYTDEILQVKLDGSGVTRLAHHRSRPVSSYLWQPKLSTSRDGTRLLYASNFDLPSMQGSTVDYADTYLIVLGASVPPPAVQPVTTTPVTSSPVTTTPVTPSPATASPVRYEQGNAAVQYKGGWFPNSGAFNSGGSAVMAMDAGSQVTLTFTGTSVQWIGYRDAWSGIAGVYIDGTLMATVDTYAAAQQAQAVLYSISSLTNAQHTLVIAVTGQRSNQSAGNWVWVDAFDVTQQSGSPTRSSGKVQVRAEPVRLPVLIDGSRINLR